MKVASNRKGISLIELVLVLAIIVMILQVAYSIFFIGSKSYNTSKDMGFAQQEIRNLSLILGNELRAAREVSVTDIGGKIVDINTLEEEGEHKTFIEANGYIFGPFYDTNININNSEGILSIQLKSLDFPVVEETLTFRFENWDSFANKTQFVDEEGIPINLKTIFYTRYE